MKTFLQLPLPAKEELKTARPFVVKTFEVELETPARLSSTTLSSLELQIAFQM